MGYSICSNHNRRTCDGCDRCPTCSGVAFRYNRCPVKWCGNRRLCPDCWPRRYGHESCRVSSVKFHAELEAQKQARETGLPVIQAGVALPNENVFAWTSQGNFEVARTTYHAGLDRLDNVLSLANATPRAEEYPPEVYGVKVLTYIEGEKTETDEEGKEKTRSFHSFSPNPDRP